MSDGRTGADGAAADIVGDAHDAREASRRATVTTTHADATMAERVAAALEPDNTAEMSTRTDGSQVVTTVARDSTGGLASTLDDYVVNATVAARLTTDGDDADSSGAHDSDVCDSSHSSSDTRDTESDTSTS